MSNLSTLSPNQQQRLLLFQLQPRLWNSIPPLDLDQQLMTLRIQLLKIFCFHFNSNFQSNCPCSVFLGLDVPTTSRLRHHLNLSPCSVFLGLDVPTTSRLRHHLNLSPCSVFLGLDVPTTSRLRHHLNLSPCSVFLGLDVPTASRLRHHLNLSPCSV